MTYELLTGVRTPANRAVSSRQSVLLLIVSIVVGFSPGASALNPTLDVSQYAHTSWKTSEGFSEGIIRAITQTPDGYLWLGTEFGLRRFDGVKAVTWAPPAGQHLPSTDIRSLQSAQDGRLWIGTINGLASWKDRTLTHYPELDGRVIEALLEDRDGAIWAAAWALTTGRLCRIQTGTIQCHGEDGRFGSAVTALYEDSGGTLWVGGMNGLWRWQPGPATVYRMPDPTQRIYSLLESDDGGLLIAQHTGITKLKNGKLEAYPLPDGFQPHRLMRDRDGGVWIGALVDSGLLHIHNGKTDRYNQADGLSARSITAFFEDREGSVWVSTAQGLDRFRDFAIPTFSDQQGFSSGGIFSVLAARDGTLWLGTSDGLDRWRDAQVTTYRYHSQGGDSGLPDKAHSLFEDAGGQVWVGTQNGVAFFRSDRFVAVASVPRGIVFSFADDGAGNVWVSHQEGLLHVAGARVAGSIPWASLGRAQPASALLHDAVHGGLWLGFRDGGVGYFKDGRLRKSYAHADGLGDGEVRGFYVDRHGTLWAPTEGGLSRIKDGKILTLTSQNGLPCNTVHWMMEDGADSIWLYLACGVVRTGGSELDAWASQSKQTIHATVFDSSDGVSSRRFTGGYNSVVARAADGKLWFVRGGLSVIDPRHLAFNDLPPPVHIEQVTADDKIYDASNGLRLPPRTRNLAIDYTALSLVAPENVRFRYLLEGQDRDWKEVINDRQVQYSNLPPGAYRFRVTASNNSGVWNEAGAELAFAIAPAYYQTGWFQAALVFSFAALLWAAYRLRVAQLARQFNRTLDARVSERTRIARELHDTLLQSFHGLLLQFQTAKYLLPERPDEAREQLDGAITHAAKAITEGRNAVQGLRSSALERNDLAKAIRTLGDERAANVSNEPAADFDVVVEGEPRDLHPVVRDEIYKIAAEALRNAFRHAEAARVEVEVRYDDEQFRLRVRDDGKGIDSSVLANQGLEGHYGLRGMKERAALIGGKLAVWSEVGAGTEVELRLPGRTVYATSRRRFWWSRRLPSTIVLAASILLGASPGASALNTSVDIAQYKHTSWRIRDGFVGGFIQAFAQTSDGYLWLGTTDGLYRFDGIRAVRWDPPATVTVRNISGVMALVAARDGTLWIASAGGLLTLKDGSFALVETPGRRRVYWMVEDDQESIWLALRSTPSDPSPLCRAVRRVVECTDVKAVAGAPIGAVFADSKGSVWAGSANGVARVTPGPARQFALPRQLNGSMAFAEQNDVIILGMPDGLSRFTDGKTELIHPAPATVKPATPSAILRDRDSGLWVATMGRGLWHVHGGRTDVFTAADGLSSDMVFALFEDREGTIWVATSDGLDRFREVVTPTYAAARTFSNGAVSSVMASHDGSLWVGTVDGLNHWDGDRLTVYRDKPRPVPAGALQIVMPSFPARVSSLFEDSSRRIWVSDGGAGYLDGDRFVRVVDADRTVWFIGEDAQRNIWISLLNQLVRVRPDSTTESLRFAELGASTFATAAAADPTHGGLWLGFADGSVVHFRDGRVERRFSTGERTETMSVYHLRPGPDGTIWAATKRGLMRISDGGLATLNAAGGLPCDSVHWSMPDNAGSVWLYMPCGLVRLPQQDLDAWATGVADGQPAGARVSSTVFDRVDGVRLLSQPTHYQPQVTKARDGRIWFATLDGVAVIDPRRIRANTIPPPVHIERLVADRTRFDVVSGMGLPPRVRDLQIDYTSLSLAAPEKNRFRVKLEGRDTEWQDVGIRRQAFYTDLKPGAYRFRVAGSNNSGVWNQTGAALEFVIAPEYYQTRWFQALVAFSAVAVTWLAYLARVRQVRRGYQRRLDERVNERTRIARDLHDTLLQSFHGLLLRLQTASYLLPARPAEAKEKLDGAIADAAQAVTEGRDAVQGLRASTLEHNDLATAIRTLGDERTVNVSNESASGFHVVVEGKPRDLHPIVRDEIYKIAAEALRNAFRHAHAAQVEVEIRYDDQQFRLRVRDDGRGIDPKVLADQGLDGHYGLRGMPERAAVIGGKLAVWSEMGNGTEVELRVPARIVYATSTRPSWWSRVLTSRRRQTKDVTANER